ncbi:hypothetical protein ACB092_10G044600 [Castanea dentata]
MTRLWRELSLSKPIIVIHLLLVELESLSKQSFCRSEQINNMFLKVIFHRLIFLAL